MSGSPLASKTTDMMIWLMASPTSAAFQESIASLMVSMVGCSSRTSSGSRMSCSHSVKVAIFLVMMVLLTVVSMFILPLPFWLCANQLKVL